jgi:hypothetical protein
MKLSSLIIVCGFMLFSTGFAAQVQESDAPPEAATAPSDDTQLEINKLALLTGSTEQMRVMAANKMLHSQDRSPQIASRKHQ